MNREEKQLLLKDLCGRLPYGVVCMLSVKDTNVSITEKFVLDGLELFILGTMEVKPYLRPMPSMTEEEQRYIWNKYGPSPLFADFEDAGDVSELFKYCHMNISDANLFVDWLNEHHFDYRGLIKKGLALEAPKDMYKTE